MNILILGGTGFVGRHLVEVALARGFRVTLFNRGQKHPGLFPDVTTLIGDRDGDLGALGGRQWDAVIDTCGHRPDRVSAAVEQLAGMVSHYTLISSVSVLADPSLRGQDESAPTARLEPGVDPTMVTPATRIPLLALAEETLRETFDGRVLIVRPGLVAGPYDPTDRFTYWPRRVSQGATVLAPPADQPVQYIDARDLAEWILRLVENRLEGVFFATGPARPLTMGQFLSQCHVATAVGSATQYEWVDTAFLLEHGVEPFVDLPLWVPEACVGYLSLDNRAALAAGLALRPPAETIYDTVTWASERPITYPMKAGLSREREAMLLAAWHKQRRLAWRGG